MRIIWKQSSFAGKNGYVRSVDIANHLELSKASVSIAMKNLKENKFIKITDNHEIRLSETGLELAKAYMKST